MNQSHGNHTWLAESSLRAFVTVKMSGVGNFVAYSDSSSQSSNVGVCKLYTAGALRKYVRSLIASAVCLGFIGK